MHAIWNTVFYQPIYNGLIFIINHITFGDVGFAIILLTILVKLVLFPLTKKSIKSQILMKRIEPDLKRIKKDFPNKEEQAKQTFQLYKKYGVNPFSGCLVVLLQLPFIFALYYVFYKGLDISAGPLYSFMQIPINPHTNFLGLIDVHSKSIALAVLAGISQFIQGYLASPLKPQPDKVVLAGKTGIVKEIDKNEPKTFQEQMSESMQMNIKYILPVFIAFIAYTISAGVALYWITSNIFTIVQEWYIRRKLSKDAI
jgi:YidC/Oxa1 family membrane protein insertase